MIDDCKLGHSNRITSEAFACCLYQSLNYQETRQCQQSSEELPPGQDEQQLPPSGGEAGGTRLCQFRNLKLDK